MKPTLVYRTSLLAAASLVFAGMLMGAPAAGKSATSKENTREAARLLKDIRLDARHIRVHARDFERLPATQTADWRAYDKQWNEIKPPVEDIGMKLARLESMRTELAPWEQQAVDHSRPLFNRIETDTRALHTLLNQPGATLSNPAFKEHSAALEKEAGELAKTARHPKARTARKSGGKPAGQATS